jgi:hypothetical protein
MSEQKLELLDCACAKTDDKDVVEQPGLVRRHCWAWFSGFAWVSVLGGAAMAFLAILIFASFFLAYSSYFLCIFHLPEGHAINFEVRSQRNESLVIVSQETVADIIMGVKMIHNVSRGLFRQFGGHYVDPLLDDSCALLRRAGMRTIVNLTKGVYYL